MDRNLLLVIFLAIYLSYMLIARKGGPEKNIEINPLGRVSILLKYSRFLLFTFYFLIDNVRFN